MSKRHASTNVSRTLGRNRSSRSHAIALWMAAIAAGLIGSYFTFFSHADTAPGGNFSTNGALPADGTATFAYGNYMYAIGSSSGAMKAFYAPVNSSNGKLGSWVSTNAPPLSSSTLHFNKTIFNGYIYLFSSTEYSYVSYYTSVTSNGGLAAWKSASAPPTVTCDNNHVPSEYLGSGTHLYAIAEPSTSFNSTCTGVSIFEATIGSGGSLGAWKTVATVPEFSASQTEDDTATIYNSTFYLFRVDGSGNQHTLYAHINSDGSLSGFASTQALPPNYDSGTSIIGSGGYLYANLAFVSGSSTITGAVYRAQVAANGSLGPWVQYTPTSSYHDGDLTIADGYLYIVGGETYGCTYSYAQGCSNPGSETNTIFSSFVGADGPGDNNGNNGNGNGNNGNGNGNNGNGNGKGANNGGSPSGASANTTGNTNNPSSTTSSQGTQTKLPQQTPSPFYDGKQYAAGSEADTSGGGSAAAKIKSHIWWWILGLLIVAGAAVAGWFWWKKRQQL